MSEDRMTAGRVLLGATLRRRRLDAGLTLAQLATDAKLSLSYLSEVERGRKLMSLDALDTWALAMNTTVVDILAHVFPFGSDERPTHIDAVPDARYRQQT